MVMHQEELGWSMAFKPAVPSKKITLKKKAALVNVGKYSIFLF